MAKHSWTYDYRIKWDEANILVMDRHNYSRKMRESIEIEKQMQHYIDQEGKPLDSTWRVLLNAKLISLVLGTHALFNYNHIIPLAMT